MRGGRGMAGSSEVVRHGLSTTKAVKIKASSGPGHRGMRFLCCGHCYVPHAVSIGDHGTGRPQNPPSQCDYPPDGRVDRTTVLGGAPGRSCVSFVIHDRDSIFSKELDKQVIAMGVRVLRTR